MNKITNLLIKHSIVCKKLSLLNNKDCKIRKKIEIYFGVNQKSYYLFILKIDTKSKILLKNILEYEDIFNQILQKNDLVIKYKYIAFENKICSKALILLKEYNWKILDY